MASLAPMETGYNGYLFRSRLEARWAVCFDALGVAYRYEPEGFRLPGRGPYLPDFWLEPVRMWAEVKGGPFTGAQRARCQALAAATGWPCLLLDGDPDWRAYTAVLPDGTEQAYWLEEDHLDAGRFTTSTEHGEFSTRPLAYTRARSARFEYGQTPKVAQVRQPSSGGLLF